MRKLVLSLLAISFLITVFSSCNDENTPENNNSKDSVEMAISDKLKWSERFALSIMKRNPKAYQIDHKEEAKWDYVHGLVLTSFEALYNSTNNEKYFKYIEEYADNLIEDSGNIKTYDIEKYNIDMINAGKILFRLYDKTNNEKYLKAMQLLRKQLEEHPRTKSGGFWHKKRYPNQMWLDGLYMGAPFYAHYTKRYEEGVNFDDIVKQFRLIQENAIDTATGLLYHGWDESREMAWADKKTGCSPNFWSRSLGWYMMALVDVLDYLPTEHEGHKELVGYLANLTEALAKFQDESGLWYQVTDAGVKEGNYLEASGTAMFSYAIAKGVNKGYLPEDKKAIAEKAFDGLTSQLIKIEKDGELQLTQVCAVAGLGGNPYRDGSYEYYINEKKKDNDPKGTGPFILAALELDR